MCVNRFTQLFSDYFLALYDKRKTLPSLGSVRGKPKRVSVSKGISFLRERDGGGGDPYAASGGLADR